MNKQHVCKVITPTLEQLLNSKIQTDIVCSQPNCTQVFSNTGALNLHLTKIHKITSPANQHDDPYLFTNPVTRAERLLLKCDCKYYCPIEDCKYHVSVPTGYPCFMTSYHSLKLHFNRIHGEKAFECSLCKKKYSVKSEMKRHEER
jgi:hypothetical protein